MSKKGALVGVKIDSDMFCFVYGIKDLTRQVLIVIFIVA